MKKAWRVRVIRKVEEWVEVQAETHLEAEQQAAMLPQIIAAFPRSAIPADKPLTSTDPLGVLGDDND